MSADQRRVSAKVASLFSLIAVICALGADAQEVRVKRSGPGGTTLVPLDSAVPMSANPYLSFLPAGTTPDWAYWNAKARDEGIKRRAALPMPTRLIPVSESEPNDSQGTAQYIPSLGTSGGQDGSADISGSFPAPSTPSPLGTGEDNGSISLATATGLSGGDSVVVSTTMGDGPFGGSSGDFDFFSIAAVAAGELITVDTDTVSMFIPDTLVAIWDSAGNLLAFNDDDPCCFIFDSFLSFTAPSSGTYYVSIGTFGNPFPLDPFDSSSGTGATSTGAYDVTIGLNSFDLDYFSFDLSAGDVVGVNSLGTATTLQLYDPSGSLRMESSQDVSFIYPASSPLPGGGNASIAYVVEVSGTYSLRVSGGAAGAYTAEVRLFRPGTGTIQRLFLDFDGATIDTAIFGFGGIANLSPLSSFLSNWGLTGSDEDAVIDAIIAAVEESVEDDPALFGLNTLFGVQILNSRDHADPFGTSNVSRVIIGGTMAELGIGTIGIAETIDVGNFERAESAVVLLDLLSEIPSDPNSLNQYPLDPSVTVVDIIGVGVGNITAHEIGHYIGNFHTFQFNASANLMDQGGNLDNTVGVGPDVTFGSIDDVDVDFDVDVYAPNEGFVGSEDTLNTTAFGLTASLGGAPAAGLIALAGLCFAVGLIGFRKIRAR